MVDVVVARYAEDLAWIGNLIQGVRAVIYNKGGGEDVGVSLPNVGREAHTYLYHITEHYHDLAPVTVFCQGHPFDHAADFHKRICDVVLGSEKVKDFTWLGFIIDTDDKRGRRLFINWSKNDTGKELALDAFYKALFNQRCPELFRFYPGGQFAVTAETIRRQNKSFYQKALKIAETFPNAAHCFERTWDQVFRCNGVDESLLSGKDCVYLKQIKRLIT